MAFVNLVSLQISAYIAITQLVGILRLVFLNLLDRAILGHFVLKLILKLLRFIHKSQSRSPSVTALESVESSVV